ncbi:hypothetical protein OC844_004578 [Tilletia horrida]|nr:hypothetical protein OC844_004578 [Tilletia horrida]
MNRGPAAQGPGAARSPRIQELVGRFEQAATSSTASTRARPSATLEQERRASVPLPVPASASAAARRASRKNERPNRPAPGQAAQATSPRPSASWTPAPSPGPVSSQAPSSSPARRAQPGLPDATGTSAGRMKTLTHGPPTTNTNTNTTTNNAKTTAVPASSVFARAAAPLHLPALDRYLAAEGMFSPPTFTDTRCCAGKEEAALFGWDAPSSPSARKKRRVQRGWEIAGDQIRSSNLDDLRPKVDDKHSIELTPTSRIAALKSSLTNKSSSGTPENDEDDSSTLDRRPLLLASQSFGSSQTESTGVPSQLSSASHPVTRLDMFPPLMLLKSHTLDELKSNAVGPRAPPGGFLAAFPPVQSLLGTLTDLIIGVEGSSFAAGILRLETLRDFAQLLQNNSSWSLAATGGPSPNTMGGSLRKFLFHTLPSILALDFVSILGRAQIFMVFWMLVGGLMLWRFWVITRSYDHNRYVDGFDSRPSAYTAPARGTKTAYTLLVFGLTTAYIPLTKLAVDTLVWNSDFWVYNPLANMGSTDDLPSDLPSLGDADHYRQPLDFCYTTTMRKDKFNFAWLLLPLAVATILLFTIWLPVRMIQVLRRLVPHVSEHNELGLKRTPEEMDLEYQRLLAKDKSPLTFMINGYRRQWAFYKPVYILCFKLSNVLIISVLTRNNCLWRFQHTKTMLLIQQGILIGWMSTLLGVHILIKPFVDMISNRSEMVSRIGYVLTAILGLLVALNVNGSTVYRSTILYIVQGFSYTFNFYFTLAGTGIFEHAVKRAQKRLDFSLDIFSPALDMEKHVRRRIWEETFSTILLAAPSYRMPVNQLVAFATSDVDKWPPYLLNFQNSAAERHVENIKLIRELGTTVYREVVQMERGHVARRWRTAIVECQTHFTGPDAYWRPIRPPFPDGVSSFFGKAFVVPFPPTLIFRYDQGNSNTVQLTTLEELEAFVRQNQDHAVQQARRLRLALRALAGQRVYCPYVKTEDVFKNTGMFGRRPKRHNYSVAVPITYLDGVLRIAHRDPSTAPGAYNFSSGFEVTIEYEDGLREDAEGSARVKEKVTVSGSAAFELFDDFRSSDGLTKLLHDNEVLIKSRLPVIDKLMRAYRAKYLDEARRKRAVMSYAFAVDIFSNHRLRKHELNQAFKLSSCSEVVRELPQRFPACIASLYERLDQVHRTEVHRWWWLFWDDLWRRNSQDIAALRKHRVHFNPAFPTSIAYQPLPRRDLELFLAKYGLWVNKGSGGFIHNGTLNSIYFYLDELVFGHGVSCLRKQAIKLGIDGGNGPLQAHGIDSLNLVDQSAGTGGGTDYERSDIIDRRAKRWEMLMSGRPALSRRTRMWNGLLEWLNLHPLKVDGKRQGLYLYLELKDGRYELPGEDALRDTIETESTGSRQDPHAGRR